MLKNKDILKLTLLSSAISFSTSFFWGLGTELSSNMGGNAFPNDSLQFEQYKNNLDSIAMENTDFNKAVENKDDFREKLIKEHNSNIDEKIEEYNKLKKVLEDLERDGINQLNESAVLKNSNILLNELNSNSNKINKKDKKQSGKTTMDLVSEVFESQKKTQNVKQQNSKYIAKLGYDGYGNRLTQADTQKQLAALAANISEDLTINYKAFGEEKGQIFVFSDPSCPYCRKLHNDIPTLNRMGYTIRHLFFPRGGLEDKNTIDIMLSAWCSKTPEFALDQMYAGKSLPPADCDNISKERKAVGDVIAQHYMLAAFVNTQYTPTVFSSKGTIAEGYKDSITLLKKLGYM